MVPLNKGLQKCECKIKAIRKDLGTFKHNQVYPGIIQAYLEPCATLNIYNRNTSRTLAYSEPEAYSEPWHIDNSGIFRTTTYSKSEVYSERFQTSMMKCFAKIVNGYYYLTV